MISVKSAAGHLMQNTFCSLEIFLFLPFSCFAVDFAIHIIMFLNTCWTPVAAHKPLSMTVEAENRERLFWSRGYLSDCLTAFEKFSPDTLHASLLSL